MVGFYANLSPNMIRFEYGTSTTMRTATPLAEAAASAWS
jgi:hypothetical protein